MSGKRLDAGRTQEHRNKSVVDNAAQEGAGPETTAQSKAAAERIALDVAARTEVSSRLIREGISNLLRDLAMSGASPRSAERSSMESSLAELERAQARDLSERSAVQASTAAVLSQAANDLEARHQADLRQAEPADRNALSARQEAEREQLQALTKQVAAQNDLVATNGDRIAKDQRIQAMAALASTDVSTAEQAKRLNEIVETVRLADDWHVKETDQLTLALDSLAHPIAREFADELRRNLGDFGKDLDDQALTRVSATYDRQLNESKKRAEVLEDQLVVELLRSAKDYGAQLTLANDTASRLARGNQGERLAADALAALGYKIAEYKPDIRKTNQPGVDMVAMKDKQLYLIDNKALSRSGNVNSVTAFTDNLEKNVEAVRRTFSKVLESGNLDQREMAGRVLDALATNKISLAVTNANLASDDKVLTGVSARLAEMKIEFIDLFKARVDDSKSAARPDGSNTDARDKDVRLAARSREEIERRYGEQSRIVEPATRQKVNLEAVKEAAIAFAVVLEGKFQQDLAKAKESNETEGAARARDKQRREQEDE